MNFCLDVAQGRLKEAPNGNRTMFSAKRKKIEYFLPRLLLSYHTIPLARRLESPSAFMGRQIRVPLTIFYSTNEKARYKKNKESNPERTELIMRKGHNAAIINREKGNSILAHADQIRTQGEHEEQAEEEISMIPSINNLSDQTLQNEIIHNQVGQNEFENLDED